MILRVLKFNNNVTIWWEYSALGQNDVPDWHSSSSWVILKMETLLFQDISEMCKEPKIEDGKMPPPSSEGPMLGASFCLVYVLEWSLLAGNHTGQVDISPRINYEIKIDSRK